TLNRDTKHLDRTGRIQQMKDKVSQGCLTVNPAHSCSSCPFFICLNILVFDVVFCCAWIRLKSVPLSLSSFGSKYKADGYEAIAHSHPRNFTLSLRPSSAFGVSFHSRRKLRPGFGLHIAQQTSHPGVFRVLFQEVFGDEVRRARVAVRRPHLHL